MNQCFLGLGANQSNPIQKLHLAKKAIQKLPKTEFNACSDIIQTKAFGVTRQPDFFNQIFEIYTYLQPLELLEKCQKIEKELGRVRYLPWGPRVIDIDVLIYADRILNTNKLKLPHPQIYTRPFVTAQLDLFNSKRVDHTLKQKNSGLKK